MNISEKCYGWWKLEAGNEQLVSEIEASLLQRGVREQNLVGSLKRLFYRVFNKYCVFSLKFLIFLNSASSAAALVFYLPGVCVHTLTPRENRERPESGIF